MKSFKIPGFDDRLSDSAKAKQEKLDRVRALTEKAAATQAERQVQRAAIQAAREARAAEREAAKRAEAERVAAERAAREAEEERLHAERIAREEELEAEKQAARDARYAARKARVASTGKRGRR